MRRASDATDLGADRPIDAVARSIGGTAAEVCVFSHKDTARPAPHPAEFASAAFTRRHGRHDGWLPNSAEVETVLVDLDENGSRFVDVY